MQTVREEKGLTYGIRSALAGAGKNRSGHWRTSVTLSKENLEKGIVATQDVIEKFVSGGVETAEITEKSETIAGSYAVGLSTTSSLAQAIVTTRVHGRNIQYMDSFPNDVREVTTDAVNSAVQKYLDLDKIQMVLAGTLD